MLLPAVLSFNPLKDKLTNENGEEVMLDEPTGYELPPNGFSVEDAGYQAPAEDGTQVEVAVEPGFAALAVVNAISCLGRHRSERICAC